MGRASALFIGSVGVLAVVASVFGSIAPPTLFGENGLLICGLLFVIGLLMMGSAIALYHKSKISTVTIAMGRQAEKDAAALTKMEFAVERGENAEDVVPEQKRKSLVVPPEVFATLNQEQMHYANQARKDQSEKKAEKVPKQLPSDILRVAKKRAAKKKK